MKLRRIARQCVRGCTNLPHVGEHPGTPWLIAFTLLGAASGASSGLVAALVLAGVMAVSMGVVYLCGAYSRAEISDRLEKAS